MRKLLWILIPALVVAFCGSASAHFLWMDKTGYNKVSVDDTVTVKVWLHAESDDKLTYAKTYMGFHNAARTGGGELNFVGITYNKALFGEENGRYYDPSLNETYSEKDNGKEQFSQVRAYMKALNNTHAQLTAGQDYLLFTAEFTYAQALEPGEDIWLEKLGNEYYYFKKDDEEISVALDLYTDNTKSAPLGNSGPDFDDASQTRPALIATFPSDAATGINWWGYYFAWVDTVGCDRYDFYLWKNGEAKPATPTVTGLTACSYYADTLIAATDYKWQVTGHKGGATHESTTSTFRTRGFSHFLWIDKSGTQNNTPGDDVSVSVYLHAGQDDHMESLTAYVGFDDAAIGGELSFQNVELNTALGLLNKESGYYDKGYSDKYEDSSSASQISSIEMRADGDDDKEPLTAGQDYLLFTIHFKYIQNTYVSGEDIWLDQHIKFSNEDDNDPLQVFTDNTQSTPLNNNGPDFDDGTTQSPVRNPTPLPFVSTKISFTPTLTWEDVIGADSFELYLWKNGEDRPATPLATDITESQYVCQEALENYTEYNWQVVAKKGETSQEGPVWTFLTYLIGDITGDNVLGLDDLSWAHLLHTTPSEWTGTLDADVNGDGRIGGEAAIYLIQHFKGLR